jgi:hypothetical protein
MRGSGICCDGRVQSNVANLHAIAAEVCGYNASDRASNRVDARRVCISGQNVLDGGGGIAPAQGTEEVTRGVRRGSIKLLLPIFQKPCGCSSTCRNLVRNVSCTNMNSCERKRELPRMPA